MRVLIVENYKSTPAGQVGAALREAGARRRSPPRPPRRAAAGRARAATTASSSSAASRMPWPMRPARGSPASLELTRGFAAADKAVLGICLGAQLVARGLRRREHPRPAGRIRLARGDARPRPAAPTRCSAALGDGQPGLPLARGHLHPAAGRGASRHERHDRASGIPDRPRRLRRPVPFRGRPAAGRGLERRVRAEPSPAMRRTGPSGTPVDAARLGPRGRRDRPRSRPALGAPRQAGRQQAKVAANGQALGSRAMKSRRHFRRRRPGGCRRAGHGRRTARPRRPHRQGGHRERLYAAQLRRPQDRQGHRLGIRRLQRDRQAAQPQGRLEAVELGHHDPGGARGPVRRRHGRHHHHRRAQAAGRLLRLPT